MVENNYFELKNLRYKFLIWIDYFEMEEKNWNRILITIYLKKYLNWYKFDDWCLELDNQTEDDRTSGWRTFKCWSVKWKTFVQVKVLCE
jgi:hypothetical protein